MSELLQTPLHEWHVRRGGRMVGFAGWHMPVQYTGVVDEHHAVRQRAGLFDVSHMGEIRLRGTDALANVQRLTVNDASRIVDGQAQYTAMLRPDGGIIDDLLVYRFGPEEYLLVVNAATTDKDFAWIRSHLQGDVEAVNESGDWAQLALQGPYAERVLGEVVPVPLDTIGYYRFLLCEIGGKPAIVSRTGYTGEDGFEVYLTPSEAPALADAILEAGQEVEVAAAGLGARDTLRLEAGMLLYGSDMDETRSPIEAGLGWIVKPDKGDFIGRDAVLHHKEQGTDERLVGIRMNERGIPRHDYPVLDASGQAIGRITSGTFSPTLREGIGLAYVATSEAVVDREIAVEIRGRSVAARVVKPPFYRRTQ